MRRVSGNELLSQFVTACFLVCAKRDKQGRVPRAGLDEGVERMDDGRGTVRTAVLMKRTDRSVQTRSTVSVEAPYFACVAQVMAST